MPHSWEESILILTKTYPQPSGKHRETVCVAGVNEEGRLRRLYPVPFRLLEGTQQFKKWEWIRATIHHSTDDRRPESHRLHIETLVRPGRIVDTANGWRSRRSVIEAHKVDGIDELERRRLDTGETLGFVGPAEILGLEVKKIKNDQWTSDEVQKLQQESLFDDESVKSRPLLRKLPYEFRYRYRLHTASGPLEYQHMMTDWEVGALFWHCKKNYGANWEHAFRQKLEDEFSEKDLYFLMGTVHRFPNIWLIVGIYYPPQDSGSGQPDLFNSFAASEMFR